ncbi:MAG: trehalose-phosphatase [Aquificota bacterium]|nr:trehalose-phosphatase [Aquificota bacterium]
MILLLDYDGTLTPIASDPAGAKIELQRKEFLTELSKRHTLAIITGRDIESLRKVFGDIPPTIYAVTSHGASAYKDSKLLKRFATAELPDLSPLKERLFPIEGVIIEEKEGCFAVHYRRVGKKEEERVKEAFREFIEKYSPKKVIEGKKVLEAVYGGFDKGTAVKNFLELIGWDGREPVIYIGDDTTDRDALKAVRELGGIGIFVGERKPPEADRLLKNVEEVYEFLRSL